MAGGTGIEWTDDTWNPVTGCTPVSAGCDHCYARTLAHGKLAKVYGARLPVVDTPEDRADTFAVRLWPERVDQPLRWTRPRMVFVNSMSDLFHVDVPEPFIRCVFEVMIEADRHTYQVLTKRPGRMAAFVRRNIDLFPGGEVPAHIWMGTSVEDQDAMFRVRQIGAMPAAVRFLSCEPLLGPLDLGLDPYRCACGWAGRAGDLDWYPHDCECDEEECDHPDVWCEEDCECPRCGVPATECAVAGWKHDLIHWVIVGGESGAGHRPMHPDWARSIRDQCEAAGVAFFFKQWGGHTPKAKGRELDGRTHDAFPEVTRAHD